MNNLVLVRVVHALDASFAGGVLRDVRQDNAHRFRLLFDLRDRGGSLIVSLRPDAPWIGRPQGRWPGPGRVKQAFAGACSRTLGGLVLEGIGKDPVDRVVHFRFADGQSLVAELATHGANLLLLDADGRVSATLRNPRGSSSRLRAGVAYASRGLPRGLLEPFAADAAAFDALVEERREAGESIGEILRRRVFGLGAETVALILDECEDAGGSPGEVLARRLSDVSAGRVDPVVVAPSEPLEAAEAGTLERAGFRLLPWDPPGNPADPADPGARLFRGADAATTAGLYHDTLDRLQLVEERWAGIRVLVERELRRLTAATANARADLEGFSDPERHRLFGEALLAGLSRARVEGGYARVPDPYAFAADDSDAAEIAVPVPPGKPLSEAAREHFDQHRRALRGLLRAQRRVEELGRQRAALAAVLDRYSGSTALEALLAMERELRHQGLPVALEPQTRAGKAMQRVARPRLEGVRVLTGRGGTTILVGKGGRDNDRLTFRLAAPEDLWFHALGRPGAHVVVRDPETGKRPPPEIVGEAAAVAAWFSDGRTEALVDVQWTRRKYVRRRRGAGPGAVILKKFETVRVRPALPPS